MNQREQYTRVLPRPEGNASSPRSNELDLITILAHDLRNYLTPMYGQVGKLQKRAEAEERELDARLAKNAIRVLDQMVRLVTNVLDLARAERGILDLAVAPVDLSGLVQHMADLLAREHCVISVHAPPMLLVRADGERLRQALHNLLANALHYSPECVPVEVHVGTRNTERGAFAVVTVRDYGPGIPPELLLFRQFTPGPNSTGFGIGLCVAQQIVVAHGGELTVCVVDGPGSCFELTLPGAMSV